MEFSYGGPHSHQKRALFFVFDGGTGLGHLRRLSCIAKALQGDFACLVVTGHRAAAHWFVPAECEYVHVPAWDSLLAEKAVYWGRKPFMSDGPEAALEFRRDLLQGIVDAFEPDVIVVDHLPLGMRDELEHIIVSTKCRKYLVTRAIQNETEDLAHLLFAGKAHDSIKRYYDRVFVAIDQRVFDFAKYYGAFDDVSDKFCSVGYVTEPTTPEAIAENRKARGLRAGDLWAVASAGGGQNGEDLITACHNLTPMFQDVMFDVVIGPRSSLSLHTLAGHSAETTNLRLHKEVYDMAQLNAAADIVITSGGYNTLLETLQGHARIICIPSRKNQRDEQYMHASSLRRFVTVDVDTDVTKLREMLGKAIASLRTQRNADQRSELNFAGATNIKRIISSDLGLAWMDTNVG